MTAVIKFPTVRSTFAGMLALVIACSLLSFTAPHAHAQAVPGGALTQTQVSAIISLLESFGADQGVINNVRAALGGGSTTPSDWVGGCSNPPVVVGPTAVVGQSYTFNPGITNYGAPYPALPSGLTKNNGIITGTPTAPANVSVKVAASNSCGAIKLQFTIATAVSTGSLSVSVDSSSPTYKVVAAGSRGVDLAHLRFSAAGESIDLTQVALKISAGTQVDLVNNQVTLWDAQTNTQIGTAVFPTGIHATSTQFATGAFRIPSSGSRVLIIKGDIATIAVTGPLTQSGDTLKVDYDGANVSGRSGTYGVGITSGMNISPVSASTVSTGTRIYKSFPTITYSTSGGSFVSGVQTLLTFSVTADSRGDAQLGKLVFSTILTGGVSLSNVALTGPNGSVGSVAFNGSTIVVTFDSSTNIVDRVVAAGSTKTYTVRGTVAGSISNASVIAIALKADTSEIAGNTFSNLSSQKVVWSPNSRTTSSTSDSDWFNGYGLPGCFAQSGLGQDCPSNVLTYRAVTATTTATSTVITVSVAPVVRVATTTPAKPTMTVGAGDGFVTSNTGSIIVRGGAVSVWWKATNADSCSVSPIPANLTSGTVGTDSSFTVSVTKTLGFTLTCTNKAGSVSAPIRITLDAATKPTLTLKASNSTKQSTDGTFTVEKDSLVDIIWSTTNVTACTVSPDPQAISPAGFSAVNAGPNGYFMFKVLKNYTFTFVCTNDNGLSIREVMRVYATTTPGAITSFNSDGAMGFMAAVAAAPFTIAVDMLSSIFFWTGFY